MRDLIRILGLDIFLIQETKMEEEIFLQSSQLFWKSGEGLAKSARGASGGIGTLWKKEAFDLIHYASHTHWIMSILLQKESGILGKHFQYACSCFDDGKKRLLAKYSRDYLFSKSEKHYSSRGS